MGLDMYLYRKGGAKALGADDLTFEQYREMKPQWEVAYWRKANAIHAWFIDNCAGGNQDSNCEAIPVNLEQLAGLLKTCEDILEQQASPEALPTRGGFFFGSTDYDTWYFQDIVNTVEQLTPLLAKEAIEAGGTEYEYFASW